MNAYDKLNFTKKSQVYLLITDKSVKIGYFDKNYKFRLKG